MGVHADASLTSGCDGSGIDPGTGPTARKLRPGNTGVADDATHVSPMSRLKTLARPEGSEHALPTFVIEGVQELVEALRAA